MRLNVRSLVLAMFILSALSACGGYKIRPDLTAEERLTLAKRMFKNKDYQDAQVQFKLLILNYPGANFVDEAQFYLGECHYEMKEYIVAADEYKRLQRLYPRSQYIDDAQFKIAMSDFKLSPKPALDQKYTVSALENFQRFLEDFPTSELAPEAERRLKICRAKLAEKDFNAAELYRKLDDSYAALVYYNSVLERYYDTKFAHDALFWKGECLFELKRKDEAVQAFNELLAKYPKSKYRARISERLKEIESALGKAQEADGKTPLSKQTKP
jgi:outer membrane protein assembly factor BamD